MRKILRQLRTKSLQADERPSDLPSPVDKAPLSAVDAGHAETASSESQTDGLPRVSLDAKIAETWQALVQPRKQPGKTQAAIEKLESKVFRETNTLQPLVETWHSFQTSVTSDSELKSKIMSGIDRLFDSMPVFLEALDAVAEIHPFVKGAVLAFKAVYTLEAKRRDNEKKILVLYVEMKDMMATLLQLKDVRDDPVTAPNAMTLEDRFKTLIDKTIEDIKACSNACDAYAKKRLLAKIFFSPVWDERLVAFVSVFSKRKDEFIYALAVHTAQGVDSVRLQLATVDVNAREVNAKMDLMLQLFRTLVPPDQRQLAALVEARGGMTTVRANRSMLRELDKDAIDQEDYFDDPDMTIARNREIFLRKFEVQKQQIVEELTAVVERESDRIIKEVGAGAHDRVKDKDIHDLWKEMGWRGNVKSQHFMLALVDYYHEKLMDPAAVKDQLPNRWAIANVNIDNLQPMLEACDADASGFITVGEINRFTSSRPANWSLVQWISYWASGWEHSLINYADKIVTTYAKMESLKRLILPSNRAHADTYFQETWLAYHILTAEMRTRPAHPSAGGRVFSEYETMEEERLKKNLRNVRYYIDGQDTLELIMGHKGRIEKSLFALLYLLVQRHYAIMRLACCKALSPKEFRDATHSALIVQHSFMLRARALERKFFQQRLDPAAEFIIFAYGMYAHSPTQALSVEFYTRFGHTRETPYDIPIEDPNTRPETVLNYPFAEEKPVPLDPWVYQSNHIERPCPIPSSRELDNCPFLGQWQGRMEASEATGMSLQTIHLRLSDYSDDLLEGVHWSSKGRGSVLGTFTQLEEPGTFHIVLRFFRSESVSPAIFDGVYYWNENEIMTGQWVLDFDNTGNNMGLARDIVYRRMAARHYCFYPSLEELAENTARARWVFALNAVMQALRRHQWSWSFFKERRDSRMDFLSLHTKLLLFGRKLCSEEDAQLRDLAPCILPDDGCFYLSRVHQIRARTTVHTNFCDNCHGFIGGPRFSCIDCRFRENAPDVFVDLCNKRECLTARVSKEGMLRPHEPWHRLVQFRVDVSPMYYAMVINEANLAQPDIERLLDVLRKPAKAKPGLDSRCSMCRGPLTIPFWCCLKCSDGRWVCDFCNPISLSGIPNLHSLYSSHGSPPGLPPRSHPEDHHYLRCFPRPLDRLVDVSAEERLTGIDSRLNRLESGLSEVADRLLQLESRLRTHLN